MKVKGLNKWEQLHSFFRAVLYCIYRPEEIWNQGWYKDENWAETWGRSSHFYQHLHSCHQKMPLTWIFSRHKNKLSQFTISWFLSEQQHTQKIYKPLCEIKFLVFYQRPKLLKKPTAMLHGREMFVFWALPLLLTTIYSCSHSIHQGIKELIKT